MRTRFVREVCELGAASVVVQRCRQSATLAQFSTEAAPRDCLCSGCHQTVRPRRRAVERVRSDQALRTVSYSTSRRETLRFATIAVDQFSGGSRRQPDVGPVLERVTSFHRRMEDAGRNELLPSASGRCADTSSWRHELGDDTPVSGHRDPLACFDSPDVAAQVVFQLSDAGLHLINIATYGCICSARESRNSQHDSCGARERETSLWLTSARQAIDRAQDGRCELSKSQTSAIAAVITDGAFNNLAHTPLLHQLGEAHDDVEVGGFLADSHAAWTAVGCACDAQRLRVLDPSALLPVVESIGSPDVNTFIVVPDVVRTANVCHGSSAGATDLVIGSRARSSQGADLTTMIAPLSLFASMRTPLTSDGATSRHRELSHPLRHVRPRPADRVVTELVTPSRERCKSFENQHFEGSPRLALGAGGRWFESSRPDHFTRKSPQHTRTTRVT